jgi:hypothetical protein
MLDSHFSYLSYSLAHVLCILVFFCFGERNVIVPSPVHPEKYAGSLLIQAATEL